MKKKARPSDIVPLKITPEMRGKAMDQAERTVSGHLSNEYIQAIDREGISIKLIKEDIALLKRILRCLAEHEASFLNALAEIGVSSGDFWGLWKLQALVNILDQESPFELEEPLGKFMGIFTLQNLELDIIKERPSFVELTGLSRLRDIEA